eukprot:scaffold12.g8296.t1
MSQRSERPFVLRGRGQERREATLRLFCFPPAGSGAYVYHEWEELPRSVEVMPVELPGHNSRRKESAVADMQELVVQLADNLSPLAREKPFALFGHSLGAWVAFALTQELQRRGGPLPVKVYASANRSPLLAGAVAATGARVCPERRGTRWWGQPCEESAEMQRMTYPMLRADFQLVETYQLANRELLLPCPLVVLGGEQDNSGGHFYLSKPEESRQPFLEFMAADLAQLADAVVDGSATRTLDAIAAEAAGAREEGQQGQDGAIGQDAAVAKNTGMDPYLDPLKTPLPASLAAIATHSPRAQAERMLSEQARQMSGMHTGGSTSWCARAALSHRRVPNRPADHKQTLTLLSHFFKASAASDSVEGTSGAVAGGLARAAAGAVAIDMLLHSKARAAPLLGTRWQGSSSAEQAVVYPAIQRLLSPKAKGEGATPRAGLRHAMREHAEMDAVAVETLRRLTAGEDVAEALTRLEGALLAHQQEMETEVLPRLVQSVTQEELTELATEFRRAKQDADVLGALGGKAEE